jgi:hypothetical protein
MMVCAFFMAGIGLVLNSLSAFAVSSETREEKAANLRKQATGGLFQKWTFDRDEPNMPPRGFVTGISTDESPADWLIQGHATAPSPPHIIAGSSRCAQLCYQVLLADGLEYEYPDLSVRFRAQEGMAGLGGVVFGVRDMRNREKSGARSSVEWTRTVSRAGIDYSERCRLAYPQSPTKHHHQ